MKKPSVIVFGLLTMGAMAQDRRPSIALQKACYDQAQKVARKGIQGHSNHYDQSTRTCWVEEFDNTPNSPVVYTRDVFNAFEPFKGTAEASFMGELGKKPQTCWVGDTECHSLEEFDILVSRGYGL